MNILIKSLILGLFIVPSSCNANHTESNKAKYKMKNNGNDSTVHIIKDSIGRIIEKWGNYHTDDNNMNFRHFYYYDKNGILVNEKQYWFDEGNILCQVKDTAEYRDIYYIYNQILEKRVLATIKCYDRNYNSEGKFIGRKLYYIFDEIQGKYLYRDDSFDK